MIVCVDADYRVDEVVAAAIEIRDWADSASCLERVVHSKGSPAPYIPGLFYLREMPVIVDLLAMIPHVEVIVIDGYVWLGRNQRGLGAHLYEGLHCKYPVIGVAKRPFRDNDCAFAIQRGESARPLYVTAVGVHLPKAAEDIARMHGPNRIPSILKRVDRLARGFS